MCGTWCDADIRPHGRPRRHIPSATHARERTSQRNSPGGASWVMGGATSRQSIELQELRQQPIASISLSALPLEAVPPYEAVVREQDRPLPPDPHGPAQDTRPRTGPQPSPTESCRPKPCSSAVTHGTHLLFRALRPLSPGFLSPFVSVTPPLITEQSCTGSQDCRQLCRTLPCVSGIGFEPDALHIPITGPLPCNH